MVKDRAKYYYNHEFPKGHVHEITVRSLGFGFKTISKVLSTLATTAHVASIVGGVATAFDVIGTAINGHYAVASAKMGIAIVETAISLFVSGGAFIAIGIAILDTMYGDKLYQIIDNSQNFE